jgi:hypothetical protein
VPELRQQIERGWVARRSPARQARTRKEDVCCPKWGATIAIAPQLPTETKNDLARCFCGVEITNRSIDTRIRTFHRGIGA